MDTYWRHDFGKCVKCGICVSTCKEKGSSILTGGRNQSPDNWCDNPPCHCCGACVKTCPYDAIAIERY